MTTVPDRNTFHLVANFTQPPASPGERFSSFPAKPKSTRILAGKSRFLAKISAWFLWSPPRDVMNRLR